MTNIIKRITVISSTLVLTLGVAISASAVEDHNGSNYSHSGSGNEASYTFSGTSSQAITYCGDMYNYGSRYIEAYVARRYSSSNSIAAEDYDVSYHTDDAAKAYVTRYPNNKSYYSHHAYLIKPSASNSYVIDSGSRDCR